MKRLPTAKIEGRETVGDDLQANISIVEAHICISSAPGPVSFGMLLVIEN